MVRKFKVGSIFFGLTISIFTAFNAYAGSDGWKLENNKWKYYKEDKALKAWQQINNNWYFFNEDGSLKTGWYLDASNNWYFLDSSKTANEGVLLSGWQWIDGYCYYFEGTDKATFGKMYANTVVKGYRVDAAGRWVNESGKAYYEAGKGIITGNASNSLSNTAKKAGSAGGSGKGGNSGKAGGSSGSGKSESPEGSGYISQGEITEESKVSNGSGTENIGSFLKSDDTAVSNGNRTTDISVLPGNLSDNADNKKTGNLVDDTNNKIKESTSQNSGEDNLRPDESTNENNNKNTKSDTVENNASQPENIKPDDSLIKPATSSNAEITKETEDNKKTEQERKENIQDKAENIKEVLITAKNDNVVQYTDEEGEIRTVIWAKGINAPVMGAGGDFRKEVTQGGLDTYVIYKAPFSSGNGWYDVNKTRSGGNIDIDKNLCFAATASNMLHWWFDQNSENVDNYIAKNGDIIRAGRRLSELKNSFESQEDSKIFELYKVLYGYNERGFYTDLLMDLFINGYRPRLSGATNIENDNLIPDNNGGFFYDVFKGEKLTDRTDGGDYEYLSEKLKEVLGDGGLVGLSHKALSRNHIVTLWGAEYDLNGKLKAVYVSDSDDQDESDVGMKRYEVRNVGGKAKLSTNISDKSAGAAVGYLHILYLGNNRWNNYFK
ncbi:MAG: IdeS/Mac family cysteine endopeptidase [Lachnospiraceae bacterium oral taxon 082]|jgi:mac 1 domain protein|nr:IdeS/Mac family cysteine endopeptidase [Lachnospiraceae bacterium oral taxon 082]